MELHMNVSPMNASLLMAILNSLGLGCCFTLLLLNMVFTKFLFLNKRSFHHDPLPQRFQRGWPNVNKVLTGQQRGSKRHVWIQNGIFAPLLHC